MTKKKNATSRAEKVRERRQKGDNTSQRKSRNKQSRTFATSTPVMVRGADRAGSASRARRKSNPIKRRYDVSLRSPGVEMRLPSMPLMKIGWRLFSLIIMIGLVYGLYFMWTSPTFLVQDVQVDGTVQYVPENITRRLLIYQKPVFLFEPEKIEQQLLDQIPGLLSATVQIGFPANVNVQVEERVPVILWEQGSETLWVDAQGIAFEPPGLALGLVHVQASASPPNPNVTAVENVQELDSDLEVVNAPKEFMTPEMVTAILSLGDHIPEGATLLYNAQHGFGWRDPGGWDVYFGLSDEDMVLKLQVYASVIKKLIAEGIQPAIVSVEFLHAPFYRMER